MSVDNIWEAKSVLVVDDSTTSRTLLLEMLAELPVRLTQAGCAAQFRELVGEQTFDLILLDFRLPDGNGVELLREFRERCQATTVVLVTGQADIATATGALAQGADGYLEKSYLNEGPGALRQALEQALHRRARLLSQSELANLREEFHAVIFHDLRSPAAAAQMALNLYQETHRPELLSNAIGSLGQLFDRLDRYLDFMRMEGLTWRMSPQPCDLLELLDHAVARLEPLAWEKSQKLDWSHPGGHLVVSADPIWLPQVFENLLANAIKYTPARGNISVGLRLEPERLQVEFRDDGPGIPPALHQRIFQRFFRASGAENQKGSGLGLLIARNVVEAHGGRLTVESSGVNREGAVFRVHFPTR
jgi:signal transduction histidine kinase